MTMTVASAKEAIKAMNLDRKFTDDDVAANPNLVEYAETTAYSYHGDFPFMVDMQYAIKRYGSLRPAQVRGVLNCIRAEILRDYEDEKRQAVQEAERVTGSTPVTLRNSRYAVTLPGEDKLRFFYIRTPDKGNWKGFTFVDEQAGGDKFPVKGGRKAVVLEAIQRDPAEAEARYGQELGHCARCGRELTDETSRALGIGPVCREA